MSSTSEGWPLPKWPKTIFKATPRLALALLICIGLGLTCAAQTRAGGRLVTTKMLAPSLQNNRGGEDPERSLSVYLPPGYDSSGQRYPVIYFLHGFAISNKEMVEWLGLRKLLDSAVASKRLRPAIVVLPNSMTKYFGSFYINSAVAGDWADFIGKDLVAYMDKNYRTIPHRDSRGLCGHSMGGHGALRLAMLFPDTFSAVYALSPGALHFSNEFSLTHPAFKRVWETKNLDSMRTAVPYYDFKNFPFYEMLYASLCRMYSPNAKVPGLQADQPISYAGGKLKVDTAVLKRWEAQFLLNQVADHLPALKRLAALKIDWGRNEEFAHIPVTSLQFSKKLEAYSVRHFAEEYIGDHSSGLAGFEGRIFTSLLPFFNQYLKF